MLLATIFFRRRFNKHIDKTEIRFTALISDRLFYTVCMAVYVLVAVIFYLLLELALVIRPMENLSGFDVMTLWPYYLCIVAESFVLVAFMFWVLGFIKSEIIIEYDRVILLSARPMEINLADIQSINAISFKDAYHMRDFFNHHIHRHGFRWLFFQRRLEIKTIQGERYIVTLEFFDKNLKKLQGILSEYKER